MNRQNNYNFNLKITNHAAKRAFERVCARQFANAQDCLNEIYNEMDWLINQPTFIKYLDHHRFSKYHYRRILVKDYIHNKTVIFGIKNLVDISVITFSYLDEYGDDTYLIGKHEETKTLWVYPDKFLFQDRDGYRKAWNWVE